MTDDRYKLYLASFCAKLLGRPVVEMKLPETGELEDVAICAIGLADGNLGVPRTRADLASSVAKLLEAN
jgi:hypothetical protein